MISSAVSSGFMPNILGAPKAKGKGKFRRAENNLGYDATMKWNQRLTRARKAKNLTKSEFARRVKVSAPTVTDWESGAIESIKGENLVKVCEVLGITEAELLNGDPAPARNQPDLADVAELFDLYRRASHDGRQAIIRFAKGVEQSADVGGGVTHLRASSDN
jgi:transcriptional regulator with XRE-family HTH domain